MLRRALVQLEVDPGAIDGVLVALNVPSPTEPRALVPVEETLFAPAGIEIPRVWAFLPPSWLAASGVAGPLVADEEVDDPQLAREFATFWQTPQADAVTRMKLFKLAWDMTGSEFAGRHLQYEKFYAGASFIIRNHSYRETDWGEFNTLVDDVMATYDVPSGKLQAGKRVA